MLKLINTSLILLLFTILSCKEKKKDLPTKGGKNSIQKVDAYIVKSTSILQVIDAPGSVIPFEETMLQPEISGKVTGIYFSEGSNVRAGALLVKMYDSDLKAQLKKLQVQLSIAKKTEERQLELLKINGVSQQDYDLSLLNVNNIKADIEILQTNISKTEIRAPFTGNVGLRNISLGAYITPQTILTTIRQTNQLKLVFSVPEKYGQRMKPGELVNFSITGSTQIYGATIIATENNISNDTRNLLVKAKINRMDNQLIPGAFALVKIDLSKNETALVIPSQAIIPQSRNKKVIVYRDGLASMETVTTGWRDSTLVEITSGLKSGDTVLTTGLLAIKPGAKVEINKINK